MKLEKIGFYTLEDARAKNVGIGTDSLPLWRCELILTDKCNFKCPYCRGVKPEYRGELSFKEAADIVRKWSIQGLKNIRFSGGEPTLWKDLSSLVFVTKNFFGVERVAISTNGSASFDKYMELYENGVDDFSISLDACCASTAEKMAGGNCSYEKILDNIEKLSKIAYVTVGIVLTKENIGEVKDTVKLASKLGVADIRLISAAQWNSEDIKKLNIEKKILDKHPILKYRINNFKKGRDVRGLTKLDCKKCYLVLDDMAVLNGSHFPCIIYLREGGKPIGKMSGDFIKEREEWYFNHDSFKDPICSKNCLDVCIDYNNKVREFIFKDGFDNKTD